jgi:MYXO-CTERM domain-containing protein
MAERMGTGSRTAIAVLLEAVVLLAAPHASAQDGGVPMWMAECPPDAVGCHTQDVDFHHRDALFDSVMLDSGWVPSGSPLQVRFAVFIGGETEVDMGGTAVTSWPPALDVAVPGRPATGRLSIDYGIEIIARIRIDVSVAGTHYTWEGDIPIPGGIPRDLRMADETTFDPFVLPLADPRPITAWDDTDPVTVLDVDLTDAIIPIPGIGGGFLVDAVGSLEGSYQTDRIEISDAIEDITEEGASVVVHADPGADDLGGAKDYTVLPHGTIGYDGVITLFPRLYVEIAGRRFDLTIAEVPLNIVDLSADTAFEPASVHVPLPEVRVVPTTLSLGEIAIGGTSERLVSVYNDGEADLVVTVADPVAPFAAGTPSLTIPPRSAEHLTVRFEPAMAGDASAVLLLATNDPDDPLVSIRLSGTGTGEPDAGLDLDGGVGEDAGSGYVTAGGCGCRASGSGSAPGALVVLGLVALVLRRRR